jgi:hypothetical protein
MTSVEFMEPFNGQVSFNARQGVHHTDDSGVWWHAIIRYCALFTSLIVTLMDGSFECLLEICIPCSRYT